MLLDNTNDQPLNLRTKNWIEVFDGACGKYNTVKSDSIP